MLFTNHFSELLSPDYLMLSLLFVDARENMDEHFDMESAKKLFRT
jgi:hypothetical protein